MGFSLIYRTTRIFHFAHASVYVIGAYVAYSTLTLLCSDPLFAIVVGTICGALLGGLIELCIYKPLRQRQATSIALLVASLGVLIVLQNSVSLTFGDDTKSLRWGSSSQGVIEVMGARITVVQGLLVVAPLTIMLILAIFFNLTGQGLKLRAVANDPFLAQVAGVDVNRVMLSSFLIGSGLAALAGILWSLNTALNPVMGFSALLMGFVAAIAGGIGSLRGAFLGALLVASVQSFAGWWLSSGWQDAMVFLVFILFLLVRPQGLLGRLSRSERV
jgi:branched-chain amino acid transport system permease protein